MEAFTPASSNWPRPPQFASPPSQFAVILVEIWQQQRRQGVCELISRVYPRLSPHQGTPAAVLSVQAIPAPPISFPPLLIISSSAWRRDDCSKPGYKCLPRITQEGFMLMHFAPVSSLCTSAASDPSSEDILKAFSLATSIAQTLADSPPKCSSCHFPHPGAFLSGTKM